MADGQGVWLGSVGSAALAVALNTVIGKEVVFISRQKVNVGGGSRAWWTGAKRRSRLAQHSKV